MAKNQLTKEDMSARKAIIDDVKKPMKVRLQAVAEFRDQEMNPVPDAEFDPDRWDPMAGVKGFDVLKRQRVTPPKRLPNRFNLKPKEILDGQFVGMFESKQDLYLLICALSERVSDLEDQVQALSSGSTPIRG